MRLFIVGATGGIGRQLILQASERDHEVTAFVRSPQKLGPLAERVTVRKGDPRSIEELSAALPGHDAVLSALGPPGIGPTTVLREGARSTVAAMKNTGVQRLLIVSAAILFRDSGIVPAILRRTFLRNVAEDCAEMERIVIASELNWSIVRPPRLTNGDLTGKYRVEDGRLPSGHLTISRADVAHFLLDELERGTHMRQIVGMAG
jgi:putative NADH-flavin reductase